MGLRPLPPVGAITLFIAAGVTTPGAMFAIILLNSLAYMPTLGLVNTISYFRLQSAGHDIVTDFPPIRIWGTIGFIHGNVGGELLRFRTGAICSSISALRCRCC